MRSRTRICFFSIILSVVLVLCSCSLLKTFPPAKPWRDPFSRVYAVPFRDFHPKLNGALQNYAHENSGNSFQVARLGSDLVILRGVYQKGPRRGRIPVVIMTKPVGPGKTRLEIKPSPSPSGASSESREEVAGALFQIIERETGFRPAD